MEENVETVGKGWLRRAAEADERVAVVNSSGMLTNVGRVCKSNNPQKVVFVSEMSNNTVDLWVDEQGDLRSDMHIARVVPMTRELERRWKLINDCRLNPWNFFPNAVLEQVEALVSGHMKHQSNLEIRKRRLEVDELGCRVVSGREG